MEALRWAAEHSFEIIQTFFGGGILFFAITKRDETKARRVSNLIAINGQNADAWKPYFENPELKRVFLPDIDPAKNGISERERVFVTRLIVNFSVAYRAAKSGELIKLEGVALDARDVLSLPIPRSIWNELSRYQDKDFVAFIEGILTQGASNQKGRRSGTFA